MTLNTTPAPSTARMQEFKPRIIHVAYHVSDIERALRFYVGTLGLEERMRMKLGNGLHEVVLGYPDGKGSGLILMWNTDRNAPYTLGEGYSRLILHVSDVDAALRYLVEKNVQVTQEATQAGKLKYAMIKDPDGYLIELLQL